MSEGRRDFLRKLFFVGAAVVVAPVKRLVQATGFDTKPDGTIAYHEKPKAFVLDSMGSHFIDDTRTPEEIARFTKEWEGAFGSLTSAKTQNYINQTAEALRQQRLLDVGVPSHLSMEDYMALFDSTVVMGAKELPSPYPSAADDQIEKMWFDAAAAMASPLGRLTPMGYKRFEREARAACDAENRRLFWGQGEKYDGGRKLLDPQHRLATMREHAPKKIG